MYCSGGARQDFVLSMDEGRKPEARLLRLSVLDSSRGSSLDKALHRLVREEAGQSMLEGPWGPS